MLYQIEQGPTEQKIIDQCARERKPLPKAIQNAPELNLGLEFFYNAFIQLGRQSNEWTAVHLYCTTYEIVGSQREALFHILRELDNFYLTTMREKDKNSNGNP